MTRAPEVPTEARMQTFVVRLRSMPASGPGADELHGVVEHVGSRRSWAFKDEMELLAFLRARPWEGEHELGPGAGGAP